MPTARPAKAPVLTVPTAAPHAEARKKARFFLFLAALLLIFAPALNAQDDSATPDYSEVEEVIEDYGADDSGAPNDEPTAREAVAGTHRGLVSGIAVDEAGAILTVGEDGFLVIWDSATKTARERFQLSPYPIEKIALRPGHTELAIAESDGMGFHRVSVWDYAEKKRLFTVKTDSGPCSYTARGTFLVIGQTSGVLLLDAESGIAHPRNLGITYPVTLAASSPSERTLLVYSPTGILSYRDLESFTETRSFNVNANLRGPVVFSNYRFLAGQNDGGLFVIDATDGKTLFQTEAVPGALLISGPEPTDTFTRISLDADGVLRREYFTVTADGSVQSSQTDTSLAASAISAAASGVLLGTDDGKLILVDGIGKADFFAYRNQTLIVDAASTGSAIALLDEAGNGAVIPADFNELNQPIHLFRTNLANRVSANEQNSFLFWESGATNTASAHTWPRVQVLKSGRLETKPLVIDASYLPRPLRKAALNGSRVLFMDIDGNITVFSNDDRMFVYGAPQLLDAAFVDERRLLIARNAEGAGNAASPFLVVDMFSGETLHLPYPVAMAFMLYKSPLNNIYAAVLTLGGQPAKTEIIRLDTQNPELSRIIFTYGGEDTDFSFIEYGNGNTVTNCGGEGASIIPSDGGSVPIERASAFPQKLFAARNGNFAALCGDGSIAWYDGASGKLLAVLRIYEDGWLLTHGETAKSGTVVYQAD